jgi:hypothetical protein
MPQRGDEPDLKENIKTPMRTLILLCASIATLLFASCSTQDDAVRPTDTSNPEILQDLSHSEWRLIDCPENEFLSINGQSECKYLSHLHFQDSKVFITRQGSNMSIMHHICLASGNRLIVSLQECSNTTWRSLFEWNVVSLNSNAMVIDVAAPNLAPGYRERFTYEKVH